MASILRIKARWSGFNGAPGYTVMHFRDFGTGDGPGAALDRNAALAAANRVQAFFQAIANNLPQAVRINIEPEADLLEDSTGTLLNSFDVSGGSAVQGTEAFSYSAAVGAVINWRTSGVREGRRVRGRSFVVPLSSSAFAQDGSLNNVARSDIQDAADALVASSGTPDLGVYARPTGPGASDGAWFVATSASVPTMGAVLRSRRD